MDDDQPRAGETFTANYGWTKPNPGASDDIWGGQLNGDLDGIDTKVHDIEVRGMTPGPAGPTGPTGPQGVPGATGSPGATGPQGPAGANGANGATGPAGPSAVSADAGNSARLGGDSLIYVPTPAIPPGTVVSDTPPSSPQVGALWWNSIAGQLYVWYNDGNSSQWVSTTNQMGGGYLLAKGVTDGSDAPAGQIGEVIASNVTAGVSVTTATGTNITSISLTAGDWDVCGEVWFLLGAGGATLVRAAINGVSATIPAASAIGTARMDLAVAFTASASQVFPLRPCRVSLATTTTFYLVGLANFPSGSVTATGNIIARRTR